MIPAVFDCGMLLSAIGWTGNPRQCLRLVAVRQARLFVTDDIWCEYSERIAAVLAMKRPGLKAQPTLTWLLRTVCFVDPAPLGKQRSRDLKDDPYLACALAAHAEAIVSNDRDLLCMGKPFGVAILTPIDFLRLIREASSI